MVTVKKLNGNSIALADYYFNKENYYYKQAGRADIFADSNVVYVSDQKQDNVKIHGELIEALGYTKGQSISSHDFCNMLNAQDSLGRELCKQKHKNKGIDLTFSAPKSVSLAHFVGDNDPRILWAHEQAVLDTMRELEENFAYAQQRAGVNNLTGKMAYALITDGISRENDPHLHTHVVVMNLTEHNGKIMALRSHEIYKSEFVKLAGALYHSHLAENYKKIERELIYIKNGELHDTSVSLEAVQKFSKRHEQIVKAKANGKSDQAAFDSTRAGKDPGTDIEEVKKSWRREFKQLQFKTPEQNKAEINQERATWAGKAEFNIEAAQERAEKRGASDELTKWQLAARRATERSATVTPELLITEYMNECFRDGTHVFYDEAKLRLARQVIAGNLVKIEDRYTSWEMIAAERTYMDYAGTRLTQPAPTEREVETFLAEYRSTAQRTGHKVLSTVQQTAVKKMITTNNRICVVQGDAGSGKTSALRAYTEYYQSLGIEVIGISVSAKAANLIKTETGIEATTLASFLRRNNYVKGQKILVDEASMLDSRNMAKLVMLADEHNMQLTLVGDINQLQSPAAGQVFERYVTYSKAAGDLISLNENYRQRNPVLREAVALAKTGKMKASLDRLDKDGRVIEIENARDRREAVAGLYSKDTLIIAGSNAARNEINNLVRSRRIAAGELTQGTEYKLSRADIDGIDQEMELTLSKGDIITFTKNNREYDICNGELATILKCGKDSITVESEDKRRVEIDLKKYKSIDYGYALTTYKSQGQTYDRVIVESDTRNAALVDMRNQYVNITRARDDIKVFTDDKEFLTELAEVKTCSRDTLSSDYTNELKSREIPGFIEREIPGFTTEPKAAQPEQPKPEPTQVKPAERKPAPARELPPEPARSKPAEKQAASEQLQEIKNKFVMEKVEGLDDYTKKYTDKMKALTAALDNSKEFTPEAKAQISAALNTKQGAKAILKYHDRPEAFTLYAGACLAEGDEAVLKKYNLPEDFKRMQNLEKKKDRGAEFEM